MASKLANTTKYEENYVYFYRIILRKCYQTSNNDLLKQFVDEQIFQIQHRLNTCKTQCDSQNSSCPLTLNINEIDEPLKQFVLSHQKHLFYKMNSEIKRFRDQIHEHYLFTSLNYPSFNAQKVRKYYLLVISLSFLYYFE